MHTFPKEEKLKSRKMISKIFSDGLVVKSYPIRIQFIFHDEVESPFCMMGVSVPKRNFKSAVARNQIKRKIREAYRLNKVNFITQLEKSKKKIAIMVIYGGKEKLTYKEIEHLLKKGLDKVRIK